MDDAQFFREATLAICGDLALERALAACFGVVVQRIPADAAFLELYDFELGTMRGIAKATAAGGERIDVIVPLPEVGMRRVETVDSSDVHIINRPEENPIALAMNEAFHTPGASSLAIPLAVGAEPVGVFVISRLSGEPFGDDEAALFGSLNEPVAVALSNALRHREVLALQERLANDNRFLREELRTLVGDRLVGTSAGQRLVMERVRAVAPLQSPVMLLGETGVGKDVVANAIHQASSRSSGPFIKVNSGAISEGLVDSELFGHERGAFTGAEAQKPGRFERAHGGTLFLDEIGELPLSAQVRLLRVLQQGELERVGGTAPINVDVRVISATHRDLERMVAEGSFREDLYFRLNVFPITIPPLRERPDDIRALTDHFIARKCQELKLGPPPPLAKGALKTLTSYGWPGNVRELLNVIERALILRGDRPLAFEEFISKNAAPATSSAASMVGEDGELATLDEAMAAHIRSALERAGGRIHGPGGAAALLDINANTLRSRLDKLGVSYKKRAQEPLR